MTEQQSITLKSLLYLVNLRIKHREKARLKLVNSLNKSFGVRGSVMQYPQGGKKRLRQDIRTKISALEGCIRELEKLKIYLTKKYGEVS